MRIVVLRWPVHGNRELGSQEAGNLVTWDLVRAGELPRRRGMCDDSVSQRACCSCGPGQAEMTPRDIG